MLQKDLATAIDADDSYVSLLESGKRVPSLAILQRLAEALGVPLYLLIFLGSEEEDLRGLSQGEAERLGKELLNVVLSPSGTA